jgi:hypothetical protein
MSTEKNIGQHTSTGPALNSGQKTNIRHDPELGKKAVPPSKPTDDIKTQSHVSRGREPK